MTIDTSIQIFLYILLVVFIVLFTVVSCKWQDEVHRNNDLQFENSNLIDRNQKIDTLLDETRAVVITQNEVISDLHYNILPSVIYVAIDPRTGIHYGCFYDKEKADAYVSTSVDLVIKKIGIEK